jgi:hypothetical protein
MILPINPRESLCLTDNPIPAFNAAGVGMELMAKNKTKQTIYILKYIFGHHANKN